MFPQLLHVCANEHLAKLDKIAMCFVVDLDDTPWIRATAHLAAIWTAYERIGPDDSERDFALRPGNQHTRLESGA